jgi:pimeloyl-[acyl-carrier protein] methyl ester esterase
MTTVVLAHGWGYDAGIWDAVRARLPRHLAVETIDFGYFGAKDAVPPAPTFAEPVVAVGHSLGALWWLTQADIRWRNLLAINGFPRFTEATDYAPAVAPRVLARMQQQFRRDPAAVLADFHTRCGGHGPTGTPHTERLAAGLDALATRDGCATLAARRADVVALAGSGDPIVPAAMSTMAFGTVERIDAPGHLLPVTHPELCARRIAELAA